MMLGINNYNINNNNNYNCKKTKSEKEKKTKKAQKTTTHTHTLKTSQEFSKFNVYILEIHRNLTIVRERKKIL